MPLINHHIPIISHSANFFAERLMRNIRCPAAGLFALVASVITKRRPVYVRVIAYQKPISSAERGV
jgi:hypothetical protein